MSEAGQPCLEAFVGFCTSIFLKNVCYKREEREKVEKKL